MVGNFVVFLKKIFYLSLYLGKPQEVLQERARVRIFNLHNRDLVLRCHQHIIISVEYGCQIETSGKQQRRKGCVSRNTSLPKKGKFFLQYTVLY